MMQNLRHVAFINWTGCENYIEMSNQSYAKIVITEGHIHNTLSRRWRRRNVVKMRETKTLATWSASDGLDTVEPIGEKEDSFFVVVGAYTLEEGGSRSGGLHLIQATQNTLKCVRSLSTPAVLDTRVCKSANVLFAACADGSLRAVCTSTFKELWRIDLTNMLLSVSILHEQLNSARIAVSDCTGHVHIINASRAGYEKLYSGHLHKCEVWTVTGVQGHTVYSGGDDGLLIATDVRTDTTRFAKRAHGGVGVTTLECVQPHVVWSGGYDDCLRVWDVRNMKTHIAQCAMGGGVWRIKFHPEKRFLALVPCMYDGFKIVNNVDNGLQIIARYDSHQSIAYGAAWIRPHSSATELFALTASFYDRSLHMWSTDCG